LIQKSVLNLLKNSDILKRENSPIRKIHKKHHIDSHKKRLKKEELKKSYFEDTRFSCSSPDSSDKSLGQISEASIHENQGNIKDSIDSKNTNYSTKK